VLGPAVSRRALAGLHGIEHVGQPHVAGRVVRPRGAVSG
jgi:hypothetical protein